MKSDELYGQWSASGQGPVEGRLLVDDANRCMLELRQRLAVASRITGWLADGRPATLLGAHETSWRSGEHYAQELLIDTAVLGMDVGGEDDARLTTATLRM